MYATLLFDPSQLSLVSPVPLVVVPKQKNNSDCRLPAEIGVDSPLTIATCFGELATLTRQRMRTCGSRLLGVPAPFAQRLSNNGKFSLTAEAWQLGVDGEQLHLRMVKIDGARSNIINTWIFPADPRQFPVFAAELIGVGDAVRVAFVDIQAPVGSARTTRLEQQLKLVDRNFSGLPCDEAAPNWATDASLGHYTYARNVGEQQLASIHACYMDYLDLFLSHARAVSLQEGTAPIDTARETLHAYQLHHMQHSPGKKFLGNLFGIEWTERFMLEFLFTLP